MTEALLNTHLGSLPLLARGKVRDLYALGNDLLFVATDRISAFDHILGSGIPGKGAILAQISAFWFKYLKDTVANHLLATEPSHIAILLEPFSESIFGQPLSPARILAHPTFQQQIAGRSMVVRRAQMFPVECVVRGYLSGSGWKDYRASGSVCGIRLPTGLRESDHLPEPIFTPAAKINTGGHDENISYAQVESAVGVQTAAELRRLTLAIYARASAYAATRGLILADTKFEFGLIDDPGQQSESQPQTIVLADEVLTPDSSRYWPAAAYSPGGPQPSFDKQYVRDYLESIGWNKQAPAPPLPGDVVAHTLQKYMEAFRLLTGQNGQGAIVGPTGHPAQLKGLE
ncbi:MAG: phosphoribosylaminoimidazolesuccinocarboxamide synthase [Acidobacteriaceae bacterium]|jgi:phosphoribosylaminoimidazole-succinocarboxamide synthase